MKLLIADVYSSNGRNGIVGAGGSKAGDMFRRSVRVHRPDAEISVMAFDTVSPEMPEPVEAYDGIIWSGSNLTIHRRNALIDAQVALARAVFDRGIPQFGVCYGIQLATVAAGGVVEAAPKGAEIGWARGVTLTGAGRAHPMYEGKSGPFDALCWHNDAVRTLPEGSDLLAGNAHSPVQAAILRRGAGEFWATQYHLEFTGSEIANLVAGFKPSLVAAGTIEEAAADALIGDMQQVIACEADPSRAPEALKPVVDPLIRTAELGNWLDRVDALRGH
jgi:GMP synthase (glutamine-hydrolysing)